MAAQGGVMRWWCEGGGWRDTTVARDAERRRTQKGKRESSGEEGSKERKIERKKEKKERKKKRRKKRKRNFFSLVKNLYFENLSYGETKNFLN